MGGIAGIVKLDGSYVEELDLKRSLNLLHHRGPNGRGIHLDREFGMGHTRMAITDLSDRGQQPMGAIGGRYWISFDGELYNFIELREGLAKRGYCFHSESDTEVVLAAFVAWGAECVQLFNGIWAFAVWDAHERILTLSRDAFGVKPLYYYIDKKQFAYVSEVKALLGIESVQLNYNPDSFASAIANAPLIHATECMPWEGVSAVLPGHFLQLNANSAKTKSIRWWEPIKSLPSIPCNPVERIEIFHTLFKNACRLRMRGDIPMGICLSGGLNSSTILAEMGKLHSMDFPRKAPGEILAMLSEQLSVNLDESSRAKRLVKDLASIKLNSFALNPDEYVKDIENLIYAFESVEDLSVERWLLYRGMSQSKVHLTMDAAGANELLGRNEAGIQCLASDGINQFVFARRALKNGDLWKKWVLSGCLPKVSKFKTRRSLSKNDFIKNLNQECLMDSYEEIALPYWESEQQLLLEHDLFFQAKYFLMHCGVLQSQLRKIDAASSAHGVQVRFPYLDPDLFRYCLALPAQSVVFDGWTQEILRLAAKDSAPPEILQASRQYFLPKLHIKWLKEKLQEFIKNCTTSFSFRNFQGFDGKKVEQLVVEKRYMDAWPYIQGFMLNERFVEMREEIFPEGYIPE